MRALVLVVLSAAVVGCGGSSSAPFVNPNKPIDVKLTPPDAPGAAAPTPTAAK